MNERSTGETTDVTAGGRRRPDVGTVVRAILLVIALLGMWGVLGVRSFSWPGGGDADPFADPLFDAARLAAAVVLAVLTVLWITSIRFARLRSALVPIEAGLVVGAAIVLIGERGAQVDTSGDVVAIAMFVGIGTTIVVGVITRLVDGRRSAPLWTASIVVAAVALGAGLPAIADGLHGADASGGFVDDDGAFAVVSRITADGAVRLSSTFRMFGLVDDHYDATADAFVTEAVDPAGAPMTAVPTDRVMSATIVPNVPTGAAILVVRQDRVLELRIDAIAATDRVPVKLVVRRGTCADPARGDVERWTASTPSQPMRRQLPGLTIAGIETLHLVMGIGTSLAPVRCVDLVEPVGLLLARNGAPEFAATCLAPLDLEPQERATLTRSSFQDPACARRLGQLGTISRGVVVGADRAGAARACLDAAGSRGEIVQLEDGAIVVDPATDNDADTYRRAATCVVDGGSGGPPRQHRPRT